MRIKINKSGVTFLILSMPNLTYPMDWRGKALVASLERNAKNGLTYQINGDEISVEGVGDDILDFIRLVSAETLTTPEIIHP